MKNNVGRMARAGAALAGAVAGPRIAWTVRDEVRHRRGPRHRLLHLAIPLGLLAVALAVRTYNIAAEPLWLDEGYTLLFSQMPFGRLLVVGGAHEHPPLYYTLVHLALAAHHSYLMPRYISAAAGAGTVVAVYYLGLRLFGMVSGVIAAALLAVAPFHVWYGQDGRGYELAGLLVVTSYLLVFRVLDRPRRRDWILYAACLALCLYAEYTTVLVLVPQALLLARARERGLVRQLLLSWCGAVLLFLPWIGMLAADVRSISSDYWIPAPTGPEVTSTVLEFVGFATPCSDSPCTPAEVGLPILAGHECLVALVAAGAAALVGVGAVVRRSIEVTTLTAWLLLPFAIVLVLATRRSLYLDREFLDATFPLYLLLGAGAARIGRKALTGGLAVSVSLLIAGSSLAALGPVYAAGMNPDWKSAARDLGRAYRPGQAVVFNPGVLRTLVASYLPPDWHATYERPLWSLAYLDVPGWQQRFPHVGDPDKLQREQEEATIRDAQLGEAAAGRDAVWLVTYDYPGVNDSRRWFVEHGFQVLVSEMYPGDTRIELWDRRPPRTLGPSVVSNLGLAGWQRRGNVTIGHSAATLRGDASLSRSFAVSPGATYSVSVSYQGVPPAAKPDVTVDVYGSDGRVLGTFPRTQWYDWPVSGVWLEQPFGFVAPPGAVRADLMLASKWGIASWRDVAVYRER